MMIMNYKLPSPALILLSAVMGVFTGLMAAAAFINGVQIYRAVT